MREKPSVFRLDENMWFLAKNVRCVSLKLAECQVSDCDLCNSRKLTALINIAAVEQQATGSTSFI